MNKKVYTLRILTSLCLFFIAQAETPARGVLANIGNPATMIQEVKQNPNPLPAPVATPTNSIQPLTNATGVPVSAPLAAPTAPQQPPTETQNPTPANSNELTVPTPPPVDSTALATKPEQSIVTGKQIGRAHV